MKIPAQAVPFKSRRDANLTKNDKILITVKLQDTSRSNIESIKDSFKRFYAPATVSVAIINLDESIEISRVKICPETGNIQKMDKLK